MNEEPKSIKVTVLDEPFRLRSVADPEYTREVATHVDRTLRGLRASAPTLELRSRRAGAEALDEALDRVRSLEADLDAALTDTASVDGASRREGGKRAG
jgi:hypothetical protein